MSGFDRGQYDAIMALDFVTTSQLAEWAITGYANDGAYNTMLWPGISYSMDEAREYYATLEGDELRSEAVVILVEGGWTKHQICMRKS